MTDEACQRWELVCVEIYLLDSRPIIYSILFRDIVGTFPSEKAETVLGLAAINFMSAENQY